MVESTDKTPQPPRKTPPPAAETPAGPISEPEPIPGPAPEAQPESSGAVTSESPIPSSRPVGTPPAVETPTPPISETEPIPKPAPETQPESSGAAIPESPMPSSRPVNTPPAGELFGVAYAPYDSAGNCKTCEAVDADLAALAGKYSLVRFYGTDCNQTAKAYAAAKKHGLKLFLGIFNLDPIDREVDAIVSGVGGDWSIVDTISVGNELVNAGQATPQRVLAALGQARAQLRAAGYRGPVVTVDTFVAVIDHPELCLQSDYCAVNVHAFFDLHTPARSAGTFVRAMVDRVAEKLKNGMRIVVTESGWPWRGRSNGAAVPSRVNQKAAIDSIRAAFADQPHNLILFSAFNDYWKRPAAETFFAEQFWGINAANAPSAEHV